MNHGRCDESHLYKIEGVGEMFIFPKHYVDKT